MKAGLKIHKLRPTFVDCMPDALDEGVLYISERFRLCSHKCCCGCGEEVVTPLSPAEWTLTREGDLVSLWPSIGNWDYACRSHYFIRRNEIVQALPMTKRQIARVHERDAADLGRMLAASNAAKDPEPAVDAAPASVEVVPRASTLPKGLWRKLFGR